MRFLLWDIRYVGLTGIPYILMHFNIGSRCTIGIFRLWCGFRKRTLCTGRSIYPLGFPFIVIGEVKEMKTVKRLKAIERARWGPRFGAFLRRVNGRKGT